MAEYIEELIESLENSRAQLESGRLEGTVKDDCTHVFELISELQDELNSLTYDEEE